MEVTGTLSHALHYINNFEWVQGTTVLSSLLTPAIATCVYITGLLVIPWLMRNREPFKLGKIVAVHNLILCVWSLVMFLAVAFYTASHVVRDSVFRVICDPGYQLAKGPHIFWYYIFYLSKFYEFFDTLFQLLRKKKPIFLHTYHHIITLWLVWITLTTQFTNQWGDILANVFVHVFMYYYYYLTEIGVHVWWKKYITKIQIVQFVVDMSTHVMWYYYAKVAGHTCAGELWVYHFANFVIISFLVLFIKFYYDAYKNQLARKKA